MGCQAGSSRAQVERLVFLDLARCLAIVMMVTAHFTDSLLDPAQLATPLLQLYGLVRGLTAPLFFLVSGWSFAVATLPRWAAFRSLSPELAARARRAGVLYLWGYLLTLPWWAEGFPFRAPESAWEAFFVFGVLQCIATALVLAHVLVRVVPGPRSFTWVALTLGLALVLAAPALQQWALALPRPLRGLFSAGAVHGGFPLAPWTAFFFLGAAAGMSAAAGRHPPRTLATWMAAGGTAVLVLAQAFGPPGSTNMSYLFLHRLGVVALLLAMLALLALRLRRVPGVVRVLARRALTFYVAHMLVLWGVPLVPGLFHTLPHNFTLPGCALLAALCIAATLAALYLWKAAQGLVALLPLRKAEDGSLEG